MRAGKIAVLVIGVVVALGSLGLLAAGGTVMWAYATERDDGGWFATGFDRYRSAGYAVTSTDVSLESGPGDWVSDLGVDVRLRVRSAREQPVFVGIGPTDDVARYLDGVAYDVIEEVEHDPYRVEYRPYDGDAPSGPPAGESFWVVSESGTGEQAVEWELEDGSWSAVVMNADGSRGVIVDADAGVKSGLVLPLAIGLLVAGCVGLPIGLVLAIVAGRRLSALTAASAAGPHPPTPIAS